MSGLLIFSLILIILHAFSLRGIIKTNNNINISDNLKEIQEVFSTNEGKTKISFNVIFPILIITILSLIEIIYFIFSVYFLKDYIIIIGASILVGYSLLELINFFSKIGLLVKNPIKYFKEKIHTFDNILNIIMVVLEILFCIYVVVKILIKYKYF
jgi:hypothetical protein